MDAGLIEDCVISHQKGNWYLCLWRIKAFELEHLKIIMLDLLIFRVNSVLRSIHGKQ
jgi:hypothetical protein